MEISFFDNTLKPASFSEVIPPKTEYTLFFPSNYNKLIFLNVRGILFSDYHTEFVHVGINSSFDNVVPEADYGYLGVEYKKTYGNSSTIFVEFGGEKDLYTISHTIQGYSVSRSYSDYILSDSSTKKYIRVSSDTFDYLYVLKTLFGTKQSIGEKIKVNKGEIVDVIISYK